MAPLRFHQSEVGRNFSVKFRAQNKYVKLTEYLLEMLQIVNDSPLKMYGKLTKFVLTI